MLIKWCVWTNCTSWIWELEKAKDFYYGSDYQLALKALDGGADRDIRIFEGK